MVMAQPRVSHDTSEAAVSFTVPSSSSSMDTTITPISIHPLTDPSKHVADDIYTSNISGKSLNSERVGEKIAVEGITEGIIIGMDNNDAATVGPETIESRASSSSTDHRRPSETNDTDHDEPETNDEYTLNNIKNNNKENYPSPMRRSSSTGERQIVRIRLGDHSRSPSSNSAVSSTSLHRNRSSSSYSKTHPQRTGRPRKLSSLDPPDTTTHTTITSETGSQHPSVTEFQKYPGQLHSFSTGAIDPERQEWQLQPNPHRPKTNTEILRIERAYTPIALPTKSRVSGVANYDVLIPRFSPSYPPVLRDYGVSEEEWGTFIQRVNKSCMEAFDPFRFSNIIVNILAVLTLWFSELIIPNLAKKKLMELERYIDEVNRGPWREKGLQVISLRRTAYLNIDIEVPSSLSTDPPQEPRADTAQGTWPSNPTSPSLLGGAQLETRADSRASLMDERNGVGVV